MENDEVIKTIELECIYNTYTFFIFWGAKGGHAGGQGLYHETPTALPYVPCYNHAWNKTVIIISLHIYS